MNNLKTVSAKTDIPKRVSAKTDHPTEVIAETDNPKRGMTDKKKKFCDVCCKSVDIAHWARHLRTEKHKLKGTIKAGFSSTVSALSRCPAQRSKPSDETEKLLEDLSRSAELYKAGDVSEYINVIRMLTEALKKDLLSIEEYADLYEQFYQLRKVEHWLDRSHKKFTNDENEPDILVENLSLSLDLFNDGKLSESAKILSILNELHRQQIIDEDEYRQMCDNVFRYRDLKQWTNSFV